MEGPDQVLTLNSLYGLEMVSRRHVHELTRATHEDLDSVATPDPLEDLDDSDISDNERRAAIARERWRRERQG
jgi:hypothetical protein